MKFYVNNFKIEFAYILMYKNICVQFWHIFFTNLMIVFIYLELYTGTILITRLLTPSLQLQHPYYLPNSCTIFVFLYV